MKKFFQGLAFVLVILLSILLLRTARLTSRPARIEPVRQNALDKNGLGERLAAALRLQTISYQDSALSKGDEFLHLHRYLEQTFPKVHAALNKEVISSYSLLYTWKGPEGRPPILLMAHMDVVPVEPGTESLWTHPPFQGRTENAYIWGRGAGDDKASLMGILEATEALLAEGFQPARTIYIAFGHDEEVGGPQGAARTAALLRERGVALDYVLDEGLAITEGIMPGIHKPVALIGTAEKGYLTLALTAETEGGHSSMPPRRTAVGILSTAIHDLEAHPLPGRVQGVTRQMLESVAGEMPFGKRMALANLWLFGPLVERQLAASPATNALIRTTTAPTVFESGIKDNVLSKHARAVVNFRIHPGDRIDRVVDHVRRMINNPLVKITPLQGVEPSAESSITSPGYRVIEQTIRQIFPGVVVAPGLVIGATDARHFGALSQNIYRFAPLWVGPGDLQRIHGTNERISLENYEQLVRFYKQLIRNSGHESF